MTTDRELLEWAAKAAGIEVYESTDGTLQNRPILVFAAGGGMGTMPYEERWNPLCDDAQALRLAAKCRIELDHSHAQDQHRYVCASRRGCEMMYAPVSAVEEIEDEGQTLAATRRAIVRAAASVGQQKGE